MSNNTALVLSGGGARGAYQVGVLQGLSEILKKEKIKPPFRILSGTSAGAINTAKLASTTEDFHSAVNDLIKIWTNIKTDQVFKADILSMNTFGLGSFLGTQKKFNSLLDTAPLKNLIEKNCDFSLIQPNLEKGLFDSVIITANNYSRNSAVSFIQTASRVNETMLKWKEVRRRAVHTQMKSDHILASSAIPMLFPPIQLNGEPYGDGCVRNSTPCSPSIRMGANKLLVIGVRSTNSDTPLREDSKEIHEASMVRILNTLLNAVMLDSVEQDVQRIQRLNELHDEAIASNSNFKATKLKRIPAICISPSQDIGEIARLKAHHVPRILRMTINAFGDLNEASELLSYLLFDADFCKSLITMGHSDCLRQKNEILNFLNEEVHD
ncbi:patatin family protein [Bdellovibrio sp. qaytius]|nr:patatin family protein [Bdellovibrio sp. qaytius]